MMWRFPGLSQRPPRDHGDHDGLHDRGSVQFAGEGLLARFVPEHSAAQIGTQGAAEKRPTKQSPLRHPPPPSLRAQLVDAEQHKGPDVDQRKCRDDVGEGEQGGDVQVVASPKLFSPLQGRDTKPCCFSS